jgi:DNA-binding response OmpR family regulator
MKVLIAEDDAFFRKILEELLGREFEVSSVNDGVAAWQKVQESGGSLMAILDWVMPGMSGPQVCREMRANPRTAGTYVILLTARNSPEDIVAGMRAGADDYVTKPIQPEELRVRVATGGRILELQSSLSSQMQALAEGAEREKTLRGRIEGFPEPTQAWPRPAELQISR